jgi:hypothetical protein
VSTLTLMIRVRAVWGTVLLASALRPSARRRTNGGRAAFALLGGRNLLQAALSDRRPSRAVLAAGAATDLAHAFSMGALALTSPRWRRRAAGDAVLATAFAVAGIKAARDREPPKRRPRR